MRKLRPLLVALLFSVVIPHGAFAQISDADLGERVAEAIRTYANYGVFDSVDINIDNRNVTLTGRVTTPNKKADIEARVKKIDGVRSLTNAIGVLPLSQTDQQMRLRIAQAIYNNNAFWNLAQMLPSPPIHIIVEGGKITLTGAAENEMQRLLAGTLAQVPGNFGVTNRIKVSR